MYEKFVILFYFRNGQNFPVDRIFIKIADNNSERKI